MFLCIPLRSAVR